MSGRNTLVAEETVRSLISAPWGHGGESFIANATGLDYLGGTYLGMTVRAFLDRFN